jgi:uncharacterized protein
VSQTRLPSFLRTLRILEHPGAGCAQSFESRGTQAAVFRRAFSSRLILRLVFVPCLLATLLLAGCFHRHPSADEIHAVTKDLVTAAQAVVGKDARITVRPIVASLVGGKPYLAEDQLAIVLDDPGKEAALEAALDDAARHHGLTRGPTSSAGGVVVLSYLRGSQRTHSVHLIERPKPAAPQATSAAPGAPKLAIIVDDVGHDLASLHEIFRIDAPLTLSVIPNLPESAEVAEAAHLHGDEVLLHLPMQSIEPAAKAEIVELRVGMKSNQVDQTLAAMLATVPHAAGVNNHQGSRATADPALMNSLMAALQRRGLFFVDSRTTKETVAYDTAEKDGVRAAFRNAQFLDDTPTHAAIMAQLNRAVADAQRKGWAVTIGHPHPATIEVLRESLPKMKSRGIDLVFVSEVVK